MKYTFGKLFLAVAALAFFACSKDKCEDTKCENGGKCTDGTCQCPTGFTGSKCENKDIPGLLTRVTWKPVRVIENGKEIMTKTDERWKFYGNQNFESWNTNAPQQIKKAKWGYQTLSNQIQMYDLTTGEPLLSIKVFDISTTVLDVEYLEFNNKTYRIVWSPE